MKKLIWGFLFVWLVSFAFAQVDYPHAFYGEVRYSNGTFVEDGLKVVAKLGDYEDSSVIKNGEYGYGNDDLIVEGGSGDVYFYIGGKTGIIAGVNFQKFEITELNLIVEIEEDINNNETNGDSTRSSSTSGSYDNEKDFSLDEIEKPGEKPGEQKQEVLSAPITGQVAGKGNGGFVLIGFLFLIALIILVLVVVLLR